MPPFHIPAAAQSKNQQHDLLSSMTPKDMQRHQQSNNGLPPDDQMHGRLGMFPFMGTRTTSRGAAEGAMGLPPASYATTPWNDFTGDASGSSHGAQRSHHQQPPSHSHPGQHTHAQPVPQHQPQQSHQQHTPQPPASTSSSNMTGPLTQPSERFDAVLAAMPSKGEDAARHNMFAELIRFKTRVLEYEIAEARRREHEAEIQLAQWRAAAARTLAQTESTNLSPAHTFAPAPEMPRMPNIPPQPPVAADMVPSASHTTEYPSLMNPAPLHGRNNSLPNQPQPDLPVPAPPPPENAPTPMTMLDVEAMMLQTNLDSLSSWLSGYGEPPPRMSQPPPPPPQQHNHNGTIDSADLFLPNLATIAENASAIEAERSASFSQPPPSLISPTKRRSMSPVSEANTHSPPAAKRTKRTTEKKVVVERAANCRQCNKSLARIMFRAPRAQIPDDISIDLMCPDCAHVICPHPVQDSTTGSTIGTVDLRKRLRASMEVEDEEKKAMVRRSFCDVCQRMVCLGRLVRGDGKENLSGMAEIVCASCDARYQR